MKFGFYLPNQGPTARPEPLAAIAKKGDELGFYCMVAGDHILVPDVIDSPYPYTVGGVFPGGGTGEYFEQLTLLTYLAGVTKQIRLVPSVMIVPHRPVLLTAKILATLDVLSQGRLNLGVGVGWMEEEFQALGAPPFAQRGAVTDEYIRAFKELWTSDNPTFAGEFCRFSNVKFLPKPVQQPHPPIWVGGHSLPAIRRAARLGDGWMHAGGDPAELDACLRRLAELRAEYGREHEPFEVHVISLDAFSIDGVRRLEDRGVTDLLVGFRNSYTLEPDSQTLDQKLEALRRFAEAVNHKL